MEIDTGSDQETNEEITNKETTNHSSHEQYAIPTLDETVSQTIKTSETAVANIDEDWMVAQSPNKEALTEKLMYPNMQMLYHQMSNKRLP